MPPPEPGAWPFQAVTQHGSTGRQAAGPDPSWPEDWQRDWPLDPAVFGSEPRAGVRRISLS